MSETEFISESALQGAGLAALGIYSVVYIAVIVFLIVCLWKVFKKAGEPGWATIVPFYNLYVMFKITFGTGWLFLLMFIPIANFILSIIVNIKLAKSFGKGGGFACGLIFLYPIFIAILAFDDSTYIGVQ